jgi:hypothetical protein
MTDLLERAFAEASKLTPEQQNQLARWLLDELADDDAWDRQFAATEDRLGTLAREALEEHRAGRTEDLEIGRQ